MSYLILLKFDDSRYKRTSNDGLAVEKCTEALGINRKISLSELIVEKNNPNVTKRIVAKLSDPVVKELIRELNKNLTVELFKQIFK